MWQKLTKNDEFPLNKLTLYAMESKPSTGMDANAIKIEENN